MDRTDQPSSASTGFPANGQGSARKTPALFFSAFRLEPDGSLFRGKTLIHLPPRELAALRLLLADAGQIVTAAQLKQALWGDVHVTADSVPKCLSSLRAHLQPEDCIQTVYKRGYRLLVEVRHFESSAGPLPRLAIPPFASDPGVPEHLGVTIAEETSAGLSNAHTPLAFILARDSVFALASRGLTAQQIGESLNADLVLAGTLRALASQYRLRVEMIRVADGVQIWVEDLLVDRGRIAGLESELAARLDSRLQYWPLNSFPGNIQSPRQAVSTAVAGNETVSSRERNGGFPSISAVAATEGEPHSRRREAYEVFLRGHHEWQTLERHRMQDGLQHLTRATELDPSLIAAKVDLVHLCVTQCFYGFMAPTVAADLVRRTAESIPDLPHQAEAILPALGWINFHFERNLPAALWAFKLSAHLPHNSWVTRERSMFAISRQRFEEAVDLLRAAIQLDPFAPWLNARLAWALHLGGQAGESVAQIEHCIRRFPDQEGTFLYGATILGYHGETKRAVQLAEALVQRQPYFDSATALHAYTLACDGRTAEAQAILERLQWLTRERFVLRAFTAAIHAALGDVDSAVSELQAANDLRCPWFFAMLADPRLKALHGHPRFEELRAILPRMENAARLEADAQGNPGLRN